MPAPRRAVLAAAAAATVLTVFASPAAAFAPVTADGAVVRYPHATDQLPNGAWARVRSVETAANETYGAHAHYKPCGGADAPLASGAHYQSRVDPAVVAAAAATGSDYRAIASTDPSYANRTTRSGSTSRPTTMATAARGPWSTGSSAPT